jgi:iron complex outermembrane recepter protein
MSRSRKRKLLSKCLRSKLNSAPKSPMGAGGVRTEAYKISANRLLFASIAALLGTPAVAQTGASNADTSRPLDEIIVTASKRAESIQDVPVSILALDSTTLDEHQVVSLDDYTKLLPGVSIDSFGPGQADISFRGITTRTGAPTSGLYIDDVPIASSGSNPAGGISAPDLHLYDINRVEALSGPQGTLYGASSLAGTLKIVTNQPDTTKFAAGYDLQGDKFGSGGYGGIVEAFVNVPLNDTMALRLVGFYERDGGYIDNTPANRTYLRPHTLPDGSVENAPLTINNAAYAKNDYNNAEIVGGRAALKVDLASDWTLTPSLIAQQTRTDGEFLYDPRVGDLELHDFTPNDRHDTWYLASLAVQGKISDWDVTYSGAYHDRVIEQTADYSYFSVAYDSYVDYNYLKDALGHDINPTQVYHTHSRNHQTAHELRVVSPVGNRARVTAGLFYQRIWSHVEDDYEIPGLSNAVNPFSPPVPGANPNDVFYDFSDGHEENTAVFAEGQFDLLKNLTLIAGIRGFHASSNYVGFGGQAGSIATDCPGPGQTAQTCLNNNTSYSQTGETHKAGLSWKIDPQHLLYFTYSTGFRPGGGNPGYTALGQTVAPTQYVADTLTNFELGWKTSWLDHRLIVNGDIFLERWKNIQYALPGIYGLSAIDNVGDAMSKGIEANFNWRVANHLILSGGVTYLDAYLTTDFCNVAYGCDPANGGALYAPKGTPLPVQPRLKVNATARYETKLAGGDAFVQAGLNHQSSTTNYVTTVGQQELGSNAGFTTADFSAGFAHGNLTYEAFIQNAFDERGVLSKNTVCVVSVCGAYARSYVTKPQFFGIRIGQRF